MVTLVLLVSTAHAVRIKDVTHLSGIRDNMLIGYGLVVGLDGTGDDQSTNFTQQSLAAYLRRNGLTIDPSSIKIENVAAVIVTATLPPFAMTGSRIDVQVSSIGNSENLQGGTLLMTPLKGPDGEIYAIAQGSVATGGFAAGSGGTSVSKNHPTVGKVPGGALVERRPPTQLSGRESLTLTLDNPDFTTARRVAEIINVNLKTECAKALNNTSVVVDVPAAYQNSPADFMAEIERLPVHPDQRARIVIDEKTGTVVMGEDVRISTLAIAHGALSIQVARTNQVSQPNPLSLGETTAFSNIDVAVQEESRSLSMVPEGVSLGEVVQSLNAVGVTPRDLISILQAIKASGALQAELVIQ
jgi:flagellar P-ring protein precursor FlgI